MKADTTCCCPPEGQTATLLLSEDFEGEKLNSSDLTYFSGTPNAYGPRQPIYTTIDGKTCGHYYAQSGTNEQVPFMVSVETDAARRLTGADTFGECAIEWQEYFKEGYPWSHGQKLFRLGYEGTPASKKSFDWACLDNGENLQAAHYLGMWGNTEHGSVEWFENTGQNHPSGSWTTWRIWIKLNTPGQSNGFIRITKNGNEMITSENINLRGTDPLGYNWFWIGGNYSGFPGETLPTDGHRYITGIRW